MPHAIEAEMGSIWGKLEMGNRGTENIFQARAATDRAGPELNCSPCLQGKAEGHQFQAKQEESKKIEKVLARKTLFAIFASASPQQVKARLENKVDQLRDWKQCFRPSSRWS